jgi:hypothetical protein
MTVGSDLEELQSLATHLSRLYQADILLSSGDLTRPGDGDLALDHHERPRQLNCILVLRTLGGSTDAAYRLARSVQRHYRRLILYVDDACKGAGMLLALAADELVISDFGELGPLDLVSQHPSMPGHGESGMAPVQGLRALRAEAEQSFEQYLTRFRSRRSLGLNAPSAQAHASALAIGLLSPVFSQIDPLQVAEVDRAARTATLYAQRLGEHHLKEDALERLLTVYPSHDFVIDREEADDLFRTVRAPNPEERAFLMHIEPMLSERPLQGRLIRFDDALKVVSSRGGDHWDNAVDRSGPADTGSSPGQTNDVGGAAEPDESASPSQPAESEG